LPPSPHTSGTGRYAPAGAGNPPPGAPPANSVPDLYQAPGATPPTADVWRGHLLAALDLQCILPSAHEVLQRILPRLLRRRTSTIDLNDLADDLRPDEAETGLDALVEFGLVRAEALEMPNRNAYQVRLGDRVDPALVRRLNAANALQARSEALVMFAGELGRAATSTLRDTTGRIPDVSHVTELVDRLGDTIGATLWQLGGRSGEW
jgi:hypothetical protein